MCFRRVGDLAALHPVNYFEAMSQRRREIQDSIEGGMSTFSRTLTHSYVAPKLRNRIHSSIF